MAATGVKMSIGDVKVNSTELTLVGTETISATVGASEVAIVIDGGITNLNSNIIDATINNLRDRLKELNKNT